MNLVSLSLSPIFIIGSPRSGTTLLRLMLTCHREISIPPESGYILWLKDKYRYWSDKSNNKENVDSFLSDLFRAKKFDTYKMNRSVLEAEIYKYKPSNYAELIAVINICFANQLDKKISAWGDKNNYYLNHIDEIRDLFPSAKFIHIVRDGRDVACSYREVMDSCSGKRFAPDLPIAIGDIANSWQDGVIKIHSQLQRKEFSSFCIRYEDLVDDPAGQLTSLCEYIGFEFDSNMINFWKDNRDSSLEPKETMYWKKKTINPIDNTSVGRYRLMLTDDEINEFNFIAGNALNLFGYKINQS